MKTRSIYYDFFIVSILFIISMLIRVYNYTEQAVHPDEIIYSSYAYAILIQSWDWPFEYMWANPPLLPYILAILTYLFEGSLEIFRIVSIVTGSLSVGVLYLFGKSLYNRKVGLISAILLGFSSFHILYSRTVMIEALWIFLAYTTMYFFWKSYNREEDIKYAIASGIFLGLAVNAKYNAFLLYISYAIFILWIKKRSLYNLGWKYLIEKKYLILFFVSILVLLPVLIALYIKGANPFYWQLFGRYQAQFAGYKTASEFGILTLLQHGFDNYVDLMIDGHSVAALSLPWLPAFYLAALLLLIITLLYYLYLFFKSQPSGSFLMIIFMLINVFVAIFGTRFQYYLLWGLPAFFIMLSYLIVTFTEHFKLQLSAHFIVATKILTLGLASIFIFSYLIVGTMAPSVNQGVKVGYEKQIIKIINNIQPRESIFTDKNDLVTYYFDKYDFNMQENKVLLLPIFKTIAGRRKVNLELLNEMKPKYILTDNYLFKAYANSYDREIIRKDYDLISNENDVLLYERKSNKV